MQNVPEKPQNISQTNGPVGNGPRRNATLIRARKGVRRGGGAGGAAAPPPNPEDPNFFKHFTEGIFTFIGQFCKKFAPSAHT